MQNLHMETINYYLYSSLQNIDNLSKDTKRYHTLPIKTYNLYKASNLNKNGGRKHE